MYTMALESMKKIIIEGVTEGGSKFRPSDWAERMSGAMSSFGKDQRIQYSPMLQPMTINGIKCITIDPNLEDQNPEMFKYIMQWVNANHLKISEFDDDELAAARN